MYSRHQHPFSIRTLENKTMERQAKWSGKKNEGDVSAVSWDNPQQSSDYQKLTRTTNSVFYYYIISQCISLYKCKPRFFKANAATISTHRRRYLQGIDLSNSCFFEVREWTRRGFIFRRLRHHMDLAEPYSVSQVEQQHYEDAGQAPGLLWHWKLSRPSSNDTSALNSILINTHLHYAILQGSHNDHM